MATGLARASALPEDTASFLLGASLGPDGARGVADLNVHLARNVVAFAAGDFASSDDWNAMAGLKVRW